MFSSRFAAHSIKISKMEFGSSQPRKVLIAIDKFKDTMS